MLYYGDIMNARTSLGKRRNIIIFLVVLFLIGIILGFVIFYKQNDIMKSSIGLELDNFVNLVKNTKQNQILYHLIIVSGLFLLNFTVVGWLFNLFYFFYEGCSIGFSLAMFLFKFKVGGLFFGIAFNLLVKFIFVAVLFYITMVGVNVIKKMVGSVVLAKNEISYMFLKRHALILGIVLGIVLIYDMFWYFLGNKILGLFVFLL